MINSLVLLVTWLVGPYQIINATTGYCWVIVAVDQAVTEIHFASKLGGAPFHYACWNKQTSKNHIFL